uniref:Predicted hydrolases or acyltransferases n=1 Tax=uncultured delta proteobacterium TaxID=34034 RepID=Q2YZQ8_9DELT|nr:predicted hydrolases or acyltransferases [uncultured delta proteobacterium]
MEQQISFCKTADGVRIAYSIVGHGPAVVMVPGWISHLQLQWEPPAAQSFLARFTHHHTLICYDRYGCGLSERNRTDFSHESEVRVLEAVISHLKLKHFALWGFSNGGSYAVTYAVKYPRRVTHLILYGSHAHGETMVPDEVKTVFSSLILKAWGIGSKMFTDIFVPDAGEEAAHWFTRLQRESVTSEIAARLLGLAYTVNIIDLLPKVRVPTLVMHRQGDRAVPFRLGREIASLIPKARFVPLEGNSHLFFTGDVDSILQSMAEFLGDPVEDTPQASAEKRTRTVVDATHTEAYVLIKGLDEVTLSRYQIVGNYTRYDEGVRNTLSEARMKIAGAFLKPSRKRENHLIWAAPGSGKTFFAEQIASSLATVKYQELNLAKCNEQDFRAGLNGVDCKDSPCLCLIDECDAKPQEPWPYEVLLPYLDASVERGKPLVFILAGSGGVNLGELKKRIAARPKGPDLLSRIPAGNEYEIMPLNIGDRILVVMSQFREAGKELNREIRSVEKLGLYYVALNPLLTNARQLREFSVRAIERVPPNDDRIKYDHLFSAGDPENKAFWLQAQPTGAGLANSFVVLKD